MPINPANWRPRRGELAPAGEVMAGRPLAVGDRESLDAVEPAGTEPLRVARLAYVRHRVGDGVEDQADLQLGEAGAQAVVRAETAEAEVGVGVTQDVEPLRAVEDVLIE